MPFPDPAWLDAQYDARAASPDHPASFARWAAASDAARAQLPARLDLRYGAGPKQLADCFDADRPDAPVFVFVHGGYWRGSDKSLYAFVAPVFVRAGAHVVLVDYDLCPAVTIDDIAREIDEAIDWIALRYGARTRIVVSGHSAGGHLAAWALSGAGRSDTGGDVGRRASNPVDAALGISGLYDLEPLRHTPFLAADLRLTESSAERLSPANRPPPRGRRFVAVVGGDESDEFIRQSEHLARRWGPEIVPVCERIPRRRHFDILDDLANPDARLHALARSLLRE